MLRTYWYNTVDPLRELTSLEQWMDQTIQETLTPHSSSREASNGAFIPKAEVFQTDEQLALKIEVPGVSEKDFDITLKDHLLIVRGERKVENGFKRENLAWTERPYGEFLRSFNLPNNVDTSTIDATYTNGILKIVFAKHEAAKPKQIRVKSEQKELSASAS